MRRSFSTAFLFALAVFASASPLNETSLFSRAGFEINPSQVPSQCNSKCQVLTTINQCTSTPCVCSATISSELTTCLDCVVANDKGTSADSAQTSMDEYIGSCAQAGVNLTTPFISNGASSVRSSSIAAVATIVGVVLLT